MKIDRLSQLKMFCKVDTNSATKFSFCSSIDKLSFLVSLGSGLQDAQSRWNSIWAIPAETAGNGKDNVLKKSFSNVQ